jgi:hypothetical protein
LPGQVIAEPKQINHVNLVASVEQFRDQGGTYIPCAASDEEFHNPSLESAVFSIRN